MVIFVFSTKKAMGIAAYMKKKLENVDLMGELMMMMMRMMIDEGDDDIERIMLE